MVNLVYPLVRAVLFSLDAETAHERTLAMLQGLGGPLGAVNGLTMGPPPPALAFEAAGLRFAGPVGLAAGLDKNGVAIPYWPTLGFGFIEVGTVTAQPQAGNPRPRMFRIPADRAIINRMGFNNEGSQALADRMRVLREADRWPSIPVGANIGKSKVTPLDAAHEDYALSAQRLAPFADYFTVNVSSPNTPGLRSLQNADSLERILGATLAKAAERPVFVKFSPDMPPEALAEAVDLSVRVGVAGIIATNTTLRRDGLTRDPGEAGGMSGAPLWPIARPVVESVLETVASRVPVIGVGGISSPEQAASHLASGCRAVQVYSALIYEGPGLPSRINRRLADSSG